MVSAHAASAAREDDFLDIIGFSLFRFVLKSYGGYRGRRLGQRWTPKKLANENCLGFLLLLCRGNRDGFVDAE
jgi:hypothetical protein